MCSATGTYSPSPQPYDRFQMLNHLRNLRGRLFHKPPKLWFESAAKQPTHTPDMFLLNNKPFHLLFEYSDLQENFPKHKTLLDLKPLYPGFTNQKFSLWRKNQHKETHVVALHTTMENTSIPRIKIRGEVYRVPSDKFLYLDNYRSNGVKFIRKKVSVVLPFNDASQVLPYNDPKWNYIKSTPGCTPFFPIVHSMWMYVGLSEYWKKLIEWDYAYWGRTGGKDFTLCSSIVEDISNQPWLKNYYHFTKEDYDVQASRKPPALSRVSFQRRVSSVR